MDLLVMLLWKIITARAGTLFPRRVMEQQEFILANGFLSGRVGILPM